MPTRSGSDTLHAPQQGGANDIISHAIDVGSKAQRRTLIVCDVQPDVVRKLPNPGRYVDLIEVAVEAARRGGSNNGGCSIIYTMLKFDRAGYSQVSPSHPRLGVLRRLGAKNPNVTWFTSDAMSVAPLVDDDEEHDEVVVPRTTFLPHAYDDTGLTEVLRRHCSVNECDGRTGGSVTVVGYGPTVRAVCAILGDALAVPEVRVLEECVGDESEGRRMALIEHGMIFGERTLSLVDFLEENDMLHERMGLDEATATVTAKNGGAKSATAAAERPPSPKYVSDTGRGGHLCLYMPYLLRDHGYVQWPTQFWYREQTSLSSTLTESGGAIEYSCPLGRRVLDLCDEPRFTRRSRLFLKGREHWDEKDLLHGLVPDMMPPTFDSIASARAFAETEKKNLDDEHQTQLWFIKAVNQNGGRAVRVTNDLTHERELGTDEQLQLHVPRPLLYKDESSGAEFKFHVKTYQHISCDARGAWHVRVHDLFYLAVASRPWSTDDLSDGAQITTMRTHRLYADNAFRKRWNLTKLVHSNLRTLMERVVKRGKLQAVASSPSPPPNANNIDNNNDHGTSSSTQPQFEVNSADWMLDKDGRIYLIECNGIPVLYDPTSPSKQSLVTKGLNLYEDLYQRDPEKAVVNDTDLIREALDLGLGTKLPKTSLWRHVVTVPVPGFGDAA